MTITNISGISAANSTYGHRTLTSAVTGISDGLIDEETVLFSSGGKLAGDFEIKRSQIRLHNPANVNDASAPLTYGARANTTNTLKITDASQILISVSGTRANILISELSGKSAIIELDEKLIVVENVPAKVCVQCGERLYSAVTVERLQQTVWKKKTPSKVLETPVFDFSEA